MKKLINGIFWPIWLGSLITLQIVLELSWAERGLILFVFILLAGVFECVVNSVEIKDTDI